MHATFVLSICFFVCFLVFIFLYVVYLTHFSGFFHIKLLPLILYIFSIFILYAVMQKLHSTFFQFHVLLPNNLVISSYLFLFIPDMKIPTFSLFSFHILSLSQLLFWYLFHCSHVCHPNTLVHVSFIKCLIYSSSYSYILFSILCLQILSFPPSFFIYTLSFSERPGP